MPAYILSVDQGTTSSRAIIFDNRSNIVAVSQNLGLKNGTRWILSSKTFYLKIPQRGNIPQHKAQPYEQGQIKLRALKG